MKKSCVGAILGLAVSVLSAHGQGSIYLYTYNFAQTNQVTYGAGSGGTVGAPVSSAFKVGVYWADGIVAVTNDPTGVADPSTLGPLTLGTGDGSEGPTLQGYIVSPNYFTMMPQTNAIATVVVVVYNGTSYLTSDVRGHSPAYQVFPTPQSASPPTIGDTMPGFSVFPAEVAPETNSPAFTQQPTNRTVNAGLPVAFSATVTGTAPLFYQWRFNGTNIGGATGAAYNIASAQTSHAGLYSVRVTNLFGSVLSSNAQLTVVVPPVTNPPAFTQQATNRTVTAGASTTFSAAVTGSSPLAYQWRFNGTNLAGATNITYSIGSVLSNHAGLYSLRVTNLYGAAVSSNAQLSLGGGTQPAFTQQATNRTVTEGLPTTFSATVTGTAPLAYQWRFNGTNIFGATNAAYNIAAVQVGQGGPYSLRVTNLYGAAVSSNAALTVETTPPPPTAPSIYFNPSNRTVAVGSSTTFSVEATGTAPLSFQWRFNGIDITNATGTTYAIASVQTNDAGIYSVSVTNLYGADLSTNALLTVTNVPAGDPPLITQQPTNRTVTVGSSTAFSAGVTGTAPLSYQWRFNGFNITNATNLTYSIAAAQSNQAGLYSLRVTNLFGSALSSNALLTVVPPVTNPPPSGLVPQITSFSPPLGASGSQVVLIGTNFGTVAASNIVYFGAVRGTVTQVTLNSLTVTVPAGATYAAPAGTVTVKLFKVT